MKAAICIFRHGALVVPRVLLALLLACSGPILSGGVLMAQDQGMENKYEDFDHDNFDNPTEIDNAWMPLKPGMRYVYAGTTIDDEAGPVPHRVVIHVTDLTKMIDGVRSLVSWDLDYSAGELVEAELAFFAQDNDGNVWRMGEFPVEYEDGEAVAAPCWIAGIEGAKPGISMKADPQPQTPSYSQGWGPAVDFTDRGKVDQMDVETCVPMRCYEDVLVISETSLAEPDAQQLKYFARGVGNIRVGWAGEGEKTQEVLELVDVMELGPAAMAEIRAKALELEQYAYETSKDVYANTTPAENALVADDDN